MHLNLWLYLHMQDDFDARHDFALADVQVTEQQISDAFKMPWVKRLRVNHKWITRKEWCETRKEKK